MTDDVTEHEAPTRRDTIKYGGAVVGGGLLAGCTGNTDSDGPSGTDTSGTDTPDEENSNTDAKTYKSCLEPTGCVTLDELPETWIAYQYGYGDIGIALGQDEGYLATNRPENYPDWFYDEIPGLTFDADDLADINEGDKELFLELDPDLLLMDPNNAMARFEWDESDIEELERGVAPFFGHFNRRYGYPFQEGYERLSLLETFEAVADLFDERERYEALAAVHEDVEETVTDRLPAADDRPEIGLLGGGSDPEAGEFALLSALGGGYETKQYRDLGVSDVLTDAETGDSPWYTTDYEGLLELDPDAIVVHWTIQQSEAEFAKRYVEPFTEHSVGSELSAVENDRIYRGGTAEQGPIINLFQTEIAARQLYPNRFNDEELFSRERLGEVIVEGEG